MNKTAIKNFAIWARNKLITDISYRAGMMGVTADGIQNALPQSAGTTEFYDVGRSEPYAIAGDAVKQRRHLVELIRAKERETNYKTAYKYVLEEVTYTWFNRLIAVRFMEVNDYLPSHIRVLSSDSGKMEPDLVTTPFDADLSFTRDEEQLVYQLKQENKVDELFRILFIKQCNSLNEILPALFEKTSDYTELLLNLSVIDQDGVVYHLVHDIPEEDFDVKRGGQVEIIGWLYQYYISEKHEEVINALAKKAIHKDNIPAATQLFTTDWVVKYMIDNSLGRYWVERNHQSDLSNKLEYYVRNIECLNEDVNTDPKEITVLDPCMGSGHILVYAFDVLMEIYRECGYGEREAAVSIVQNNLFGLDIDKRAFQLAYFSIIMKARQYNRRIFSNNIEPNVYYFNSHSLIDPEDIILNGPTRVIGCYLAEQFKDADSIGSLLTLESYDYKTFVSELLNYKHPGQLDFQTSKWVSETIPTLVEYAKIANILVNRYSVVCTNPPYMNKFEGGLKDYINSKYKSYGADLFSTFIYRNFDLCSENGYTAFMSPFVWMFIKAYEKLREFIISDKSIVSLVQMEYSAFEEATVPICSFVLKNNNNLKAGKYIRLSDFKGGMEVQRRKVIEALNNDQCPYLYTTDMEDFRSIPGMPIAYWAGEGLIEAFKKGVSVADVSKGKSGQNTGDNNRFLRMWFEVDISKIGFNLDESYDGILYKWIPYNKGGDYRRWYGNYNYVVNWLNDGEEIKEYAVIRNNGKHWSRYIQNLDCLYKEGITWSIITSGMFSMRYLPKGFICDYAGCAIFPKDRDLYYLLGLFNTKIAEQVLKMINPTINCQPGNVGNMPYICDEDKKNEIRSLVKRCIDLSKSDWNSRETSWGFLRHPMLAGNYVSSTTTKWIEVCESRFKELKYLEEKINQLFIKIYNLSGEMTPYVEDKDVTVYCPDTQTAIKSLISYAVGCMFGRYSLDENGIVNTDKLINQNCYWSFLPDEDNVIPISDEEYLEDDIVSRLCTWLKVVYGEFALEENLDFIATALGNKGTSSRESIRNYFLNDFFKDHCQTYSVTGSGKRPIYWLFDSGNQNGFKAIIYLHRYNADTIGNLRIDYLHRMQRIYESEISRMQDMIDHSTNTREVAQATKRREKLTKQLKECREYDEKLAHLALSRIELDLDDGVKINYRRVQTANDGKYYEVLADAKNIMANDKLWKQYKEGKW